MSAAYRFIVPVLLGFAASGCSTTAAVQPTVAKPEVAQAPATPPADATLQFSELFASGGSALQPSELAQQLVGKRVRMVGFMAELEHGPVGAFYLTAQPVRCDESGAGTADLPIASVLVAVPFAANKQIPHVAGPLEVIGAFELGNQTDAQGFPSSFRLRLDDSVPAAGARAPKITEHPHEASVSHR
jgi:hypothetical protein